MRASILSPVYFGTSCSTSADLHRSLAVDQIVRTMCESGIAGVSAFEEAKVSMHQRMLISRAFVALRPFKV